jgi:hypothetical protein
MFSEDKGTTEVKLTALTNKIHELDVHIKESEEQRTRFHGDISTLQQSLAGAAFEALQHDDEKEDAVDYLQGLIPDYSDQERDAIIVNLEKIAVFKNIPDEVLMIIGGKDRFNSAHSINSEVISLQIEGRSISLNGITCGRDSDFIFTYPTTATQYGRDKMHGLLVGKEQINEFIHHMTDEQQSNLAFELSLTLCDNPRTHELWHTAPEAFRDHAVEAGLWRLEWVASDTVDPFDAVYYQFEKIRQMLALYQGCEDLSSIDAVNASIDTLAKTSPLLRDERNRYSLGEESYYSWQQLASRRERAYEW